MSRKKNYNNLLLIIYISFNYINFILIKLALFIIKQLIT
jgi:hypothetical protein